ncbi:MAG: hypothetical protein AAFP67_15100, partial [Pseudomonadota bacterium]
MAKRPVIALISGFFTLSSVFLTAATSAPVAVSVNAIQSEGPCDKRYIVERGDTLSIIAGRVLGDIRAFDRLHALNRATIGPNPAELEVGTVLRLPCPEEQAEEAPVVAAAPTLDLPAEAEAAEDEARRASPSLGV